MTSHDRPAPARDGAMVELRNWAGNVTFTAPEIARPTTVDELQRIVAASSGRQLHALGARHSFTRVADATDVLVDLSSLEVATELVDDGVWCGGGTRYGDLSLDLHRHGRAVHNLPSLPHVTVCGAVATGTHGSGATNRALSSAVDAIELVTASGDLVELAAGDADFDGAVVSLGALGVISRVRLRTEPTFDVAQIVYDGLSISSATDHVDELMSLAYSVSLFTRWRTDRIDQVWVKRRTDAAVPELPTWFDADPADRPRHPLDGVSPDACTGQLDAAGPWFERLPHFRLDHTPSHGAELQSEYFVPFAHAADAMRAVAGLGERLAPVLLVSEVRAVAGDTQWLSPASRGDQLCLHFTWRLDPDAVAGVLPQVEAALAPFAPLPHWGKLATMPADLVRSRLAGVARFGRLARRIDPDGMFRNELVRDILGDG